MRAQRMWTEHTNCDEEILEAVERILRRRLDRQGKIVEPSAAATYLWVHCGHAQREVFGCIVLDTRHQILASRISSLAL